MISGENNYVPFDSAAVTSVLRVSRAEGEIVLTLRNICHKSTKQPSQIKL